MKKWNEVIEEKISAEHRKNVLDAARKQFDLKSHATWDRRQFFWKSFSLGCASLAAVFGIVWVKRRSGDLDMNSPQDALLGMELSATSEDLDVVADLDIIDDLEVLEKWEPS